jgi:hypothetical protein
MFAFEVAMKDAAFVRELQGARERGDRRRDFRQRQGSAGRQLLLQAAPVQQFHDQERTAVRVDVEIQDGDEVGMAKLG